MRIGAVELDETYYPGVDLYCDGAVEDELLEIVSTYPEEAYNQVIAEKKDWAILYHLSHVRANIVEWLPISKEESVLEIGSGCGAITGTLSDKAAKVDCIELSKKRSMINASRNKNRNNITIKLGNFQEVEENLTEKYDWITLIGVFEYGQGYINSPTPYKDFLLKTASHLKPGGKVVIAIENRLGLKYFAGCTEDHCGVLFEGIEGYRTTKGVRTFSKPELEKIMDEAGFTKREFYYPYPDYKLPMSCYSDQYLPKLGELRTNRNNFDRKRLEIFHESEAFDSMIESGLFPQFSNSFLVILEREDAAENSNTPAEKNLFSKYSNERAGRFALRTDIMETAGVRQVKKAAMYPEGNAHIRNIERWYQELKKRYDGTGIDLNRCTLKEDALYLEYLEGDTLEHQMDGYLLNGQTEILTEKLSAYLNEVKKGFVQERFVMTPQFEEVFGKVSLPEDLLCSDVVNVDMVLNNVILNGKWTLIDYEWTFDFPIPYHFVVYRILTYYLNGSTSRDCLHSLNLYEKFGLSEQELEIYEKMERHFQAVYVVSEGADGGQHVPIRDLFDAISPGSMDLTGLRFQEQSERAARMVQCYQAPDLGFSEELSEKRDVAEDGVFEGSFAIDTSSQFVRLDPCSKYCVVKNLKISWGKSVKTVQTNGITGKDGNLFFAVEDPQIIVQRPSGADRMFHVSFEVEYLEKETALMRLQEEFTLQNQMLNETREKLAQKEALIHEMENTKVWKAYRKLKRN